jgi:hypothetical protein
MPFVNGRWVAENDSSADKLNAMTATDSPYMKLARNTAAETVNSRGLLNSSIAAGASQAAAIAAAQPFALQDANNTATKNLAYEQAGQASDLSKQEAGQTSGLSAQQAAQALKAQQEAELSQSNLSKQEYGQQSGLLNIQGTQAKDLAGINNLSAQTIADKNIAGQTGIADKNNAAEMARTQATLASTERTNATNGVLNADANYLQAFGNIAGNANIPAGTRDAYLDNILAIRTSGVDAVQQMYGIKLDWGSNAPVPAAANVNTTPAPAPTKKGDILQTIASPISTKTGRGLLTRGLSSLF